jgi:TPR repeat protein
MTWGLTIRGAARGVVSRAMGGVLAASLLFGVPVSAQDIPSQDVSEMEIAPAFIVERYRARAEAGDAGAAFRLGLLYEEGLVDGAPDLVSAARWYGAAAEGGHGPAQFKRGAMHMGGIGGPPDFAAAARLYRAAAEQGIAEAQFNLAILLSQGIGVPADREEAIRWYEQAAFRGIVPAMRELGLLYMGGAADRPRDGIEAWAWLTLAAENGDGEAADRLPGLAGDLTDTERVEARRLADAYRQLRITR